MLLEINLKHYSKHKDRDVMKQTDWQHYLVGYMVVWQVATTLASSFFVSFMVWGHK